MQSGRQSKHHMHKICCITQIVLRIYNRLTNSDFYNSTQLSMNNLAIALIIVPFICSDERFGSKRSWIKNTVKDETKDKTPIGCFEGNHLK